jgi:DNA-binding transcriptional regulator LsrR (DeoR family)
VGSDAARDVLMDDRYLGSMTAEWANLTTLLAGIGALEPSPLLASSGNAVDASEAEVLKSAGAVGDVCLRFYDARDAAVATELDTRILGISRETLRTAPRRIGVAGGARKYGAIRGAVLGRWVNILITDRVTATRLLREEPA